MSLNKVIFFLLLLFLGLPQIAIGQGDKLVYTQSIVKHEYLNPAYNSFRDYTSFSMFARDQWRGVTGSPQYIAVSAHTPVKIAGFGVGMILLGEKIGLRSKFQGSLTASQNVRIGKNSFLALGLGFGMQNIAYNTDDAVTQDDASYINYDDLDYRALNSTLGLFYFSKYVFAGLSTELVFNKEENDDEVLLPGVSVVVGGTMNLTEQIVFRPDLEVKYYPDKEVVWENGEMNISYFDPMFDLSFNFLIKDMFWLGVERRFTQSQIFSIDLLLAKQLQIGYSYELGIGDGVNNFDSQSIRLCYNIMPKNARKNFSTKSRYRIGKSSNSPYK